MFGNSTTISVLGLVLIMAIGGGIIVLSWLLPMVVRSMQGVIGKGVERSREGLVNGTWQLQMAGFRGQGKGGIWTGSEEEVPLPDPGTRFAML